MKHLEILSSKGNSIIKQSTKLKIKKYRQESGQFMVEGVRFVEEAIMSGAPVKYCLCSEELHGDRVELILGTMAKKNIKVYMVKGELMGQICDTETPQGIAAVIEKKDPDIDRLIEDCDFLILVDRIQDPGNLGTIIRTADAAGAGGVILAEGTVDLYSPKVLRSTMGSIFHVPVVSSLDIIDTIDKMKSNGFKVYVSSLEAAAAYYQEDYRGRTAIVIGNEANGVDSSIILHADRLVKIPMPGQAESLNAAVAGGILMFEVVRSRLRL